MTRLAETLDTALKEHIYAVLDAHKAGAPVPEIEPDFIPDSFGAICERIAIEHVRAWNIEDSIGEAIKRGDREAVFQLKCKLDTCWKVVRPRLLAALNRKADDAIVNARSLVEDSVKLYKGYEEPTEPKPRAQWEFTKEERGCPVDERLNALERRCDANGIYEL